MRGDLDGAFIDSLLFVPNGDLVSTFSSLFSSENAMVSFKTMGRRVAPDESASLVVFDTVAWFDSGTLYSLN